MKCLVIVDAQNDFLPNGSFNSKAEYLDVIDKINSVRLNLYKCTEESLLKLKDCKDIIEEKEEKKYEYMYEDKDIVEYSKCHNIIDDENNNEDIYLFPMNENIHNNINGYPHDCMNNIYDSSNINCYNNNNNNNEINNNCNNNHDNNVVNLTNHTEHADHIIDYNNIKTNSDDLNFGMCILTVDYHPAMHISFAETHRLLYEKICNNNLKYNNINNKSNMNCYDMNNSENLCINNNENEEMKKIDVNNNLIIEETEIESYLKNNNIHTLSDVLNNIDKIKSSQIIYKNIKSKNDIMEYHKINFLNENIDVWPVHCVKNTYGCKVHNKLIRHINDIIIKKAQNENKDSHTIFENEQVNGNIQKLLKQKNITSVYVCGFIFEYCVKETALSFLNMGYETYIVEDATAYLFDRQEDKLFLQNKGIKFINSSKLLS
ncbi:nicotinamidase, putative [Plasmodium reichenowi]|uniref:nicotinamidase n=1 Tax=Plasmodium reichenowi TaxID=5854 RepID=A0A060RSX7_PLARE|nr:nicotinamidase, putative [Plasmodium reichenowi]KYO02699.1 nicotinamidase, putative [Plasmodium reichenowi]CDO62629.1 nicotinamidase, putative [Plasmodium reichenowi]SOV75968.1 nicotinamidase, putative [Plasmodium reichenowi]